MMDVLNSAEVAELWKVFATDDVFCEPEFARPLEGWQNFENTMASQFPSLPSDERHGHNHDGGPLGQRLEVWQHHQGTM